MEKPQGSPDSIIEPRFRPQPERPRGLEQNLPEPTGTLYSDRLDLEDGDDPLMFDLNAQTIIRVFATRGTPLSTEEAAQIALQLQPREAEPIGMYSMTRLAEQLIEVLTQYGHLHETRSGRRGKGPVSKFKLVRPPVRKDRNP